MRQWLPLSALVALLVFALGAAAEQPGSLLDLEARDANDGLLHLLEGGRVPAALHQDPGVFALLQRRRFVPALHGELGHRVHVEPLEEGAQLFGGGAAPLPCGGSLLTQAGNFPVLNVNGDADVDISDPIYVLTYLFGTGNPPVLGTDCVLIVGCASTCTP